MSTTGSSVSSSSPVDFVSYTMHKYHNKQISHHASFSNEFFQIISQLNKLSQAEAKAKCLDRGAQLASIHSEAQNRFITGILGYLLEWPVFTNRAGHSTSSFFFSCNCHPHIPFSVRWMENCRLSRTTFL